jgi:hypothetical protein
MTALIAETTTLRTVGRKIAMRVVGVVAALGLVTACTTSDSGGPSNQAMGTFMGAAVGGAVGGLGGRRETRRAAEHPRRRQHLPADRTHGHQERPDDDRDDDLLQGLRFIRSEAGFCLIHSRRPARFWTLPAVALRKSAWQPLMWVGAYERRG